MIYFLLFSLCLFLSLFYYPFLIFLLIFFPPFFLFFFSSFPLLFFSSLLNFSFTLKFFHLSLYFLFDCCKQSLKQLLIPHTLPSTPPGIDFFWRGLFWLKLISYTPPIFHKLSSSFPKPSLFLFSFFLFFHWSFWLQ